MVRERLSMLGILLLSMLVTTGATAALVSDGSDGVFAPLQSIDLVPDEDAVFHFSSINIVDDVLVSLDAQGRDEDIFFLSSGDIVIDGLFDYAGADVHLLASGSIRLSGRIYGSGTLNLEAQEIHIVDNPNGTDDVHYPNGGSIALIADGLWDESWDPASVPGSSVTIVNTVLDPDFDLIGIELTDNFGSGVTITHQGTLVTPLPAALWVFGPALLALVGYRRLSV